MVIMVLTSPFTKHSLNKLFEKSLDYIPKRYWNLVNLTVTKFSKKSIGSPIIFSENDELFFTEKLSINDMTEEEYEEFLAFCYPENLSDRTMEIEFDKPYLQSASYFIIRDFEGSIVGCALYITKSLSNRLPIEHGIEQQSGNYFDTQKYSSTDKNVEIYRFRRASHLKKRQIRSIIQMIFKGVWAKTIQTGTQYLYLSCSGNKAIQNLYCKTLDFTPLGIDITYDQKTTWHTLVMDCKLHESSFSKISKHTFSLQRYTRKNLLQMKLL